LIDPDKWVPAEVAPDGTKVASVPVQVLVETIDKALKQNSVYYTITQFKPSLIRFEEFYIVSELDIYVIKMLKIINKYLFLFET
jgi:hypothetical protein